MVTIDEVQTEVAAAGQPGGTRGAGQVGDADVSGSSVSREEIREVVRELIREELERWLRTEAGR